jgi:hypothetical protein
VVARVQCITGILVTLCLHEAAEAVAPHSTMQVLKHVVARVIASIITNQYALAHIHCATGILVTFLDRNKTRVCMSNHQKGEERLRPCGTQLDHNV